MRVKQQWVPYWEWEDWINGMWGKSDNEEHDLQKAIEFTGNWVAYGEAMGEVIEAWPRTMINSLTNTSINRRAFIGHCAVTYKLGIPEYITRQAWKYLTDEQRAEADAVATKHIKSYEKKNIELRKNVGETLLP